jgi:nitrogen fixation protein NifQ
MTVVTIPLSELPVLRPVRPVEPTSRGWAPQSPVRLADEIEDLTQLLLAHATYPGVLATHLAHALAEASMGPRHLWEDLGLGSRDELNALMQAHFTSLKQLNSGNMRWKKFFYRMLCEQADVLICKSPHCDACEDHAVCFDGQD